MSLLRIPGGERLHMFWCRPFDLDISSRQWDASFSCVHLSSTQNGILPCFRGSIRNSRKDRWRSLIGTSLFLGILRTECKKSSRSSTCLCGIRRRRASEITESGLSRMTILPTISLNASSHVSLSSSSCSLSSWSRTGRYLTSWYES